MALTEIDRLVEPLPPTICSLSTMVTPSTLLSRIVFGPGEALMAPLPTSPLKVAPTIDVEPLAVRAPQEPATAAFAVTSEASRSRILTSRSPTTSSATLLTVAVALASVEPDAWTVNRPVSRMSPVWLGETETPRALSESL